MLGDLFFTKDRLRPPKCELAKARWWQSGKNPASKGLSLKGPEPFGLLEVVDKICSGLILRDLRQMHQGLKLLTGLTDRLSFFHILLDHTRPKSG